MSDPIKFTSPESATEVWACGVCRTVASSTVTHGEKAREVAERHCDAPKCSRCGAPKRRDDFSWPCGACSREESRRRDERERLNLARATAIELAAYDGEYVFVDGAENDGFVHVGSISDALAEMADPPRRGWACEPYGPDRIDAYYLVEDIVKDMHEDAGEQIIDVEELQALLDVWVARQTIKSYRPDKTRAVDLGAVVDEILAERGLG